MYCFVQKKFDGKIPQKNRTTNRVGLPTRIKHDESECDSFILLSMNRARRCHQKRNRIAAPRLPASSRSPELKRRRLYLRDGSDQRAEPVALAIPAPTGWPALLDSEKPNPNEEWVAPHSGKPNPNEDYAIPHQGKPTPNQKRAVPHLGMPNLNEEWTVSHWAKPVPNEEWTIPD